MNQFQEINLSNLRRFVDGMGDRSYEGWIFMAAPDCSVTNQGDKSHEEAVNEMLKNARKKFSTFLKSKNMFSQFCTKNFMVTDQQSLRFLGIS